MLRHTNIIKCRGEFGRDYTVFERTHFFVHMTPTGRIEVPGVKDFVTSGGEHLNYVDTQTFRLVLTNELVHRL